MSQTAFDTLILGQGLAGSALAWSLIRAGERVGVIDDGHRSASSAVAAGLINPLAGLRFTRRPEVSDWLDAADRWYAEIARRFGRPFRHDLPMLRLFRSAEQRRFYDRQAADPENRSLIGAAFGAAACPEPIAAPYGGFLQQRTGYVDLPLLLATLRGWLRGQQCLIEDRLDPEQIVLGDGAVQVSGLSARRLVFCDGARLRDNPWFRDLPLRPEKGEIVDLEAADWRPRHIVNGAHWLLPLDNGLLRLGATHGHHRIDLEVTTAGRDELLAGWHAWRPTGAAPRVVRQVAGVRPGTSDRYPLIGRHAERPQLWVFNGFGARGALSIPWYAERLTAHLVQHAPLPAEADIRRFA